MPHGRSETAAEIARGATAPLRKGETVDLTGLDISDALDLAGAAITNVDFSGTRFGGPVDLRGATFGGLAWFKGATFAAPVDMTGAVFNNDLRLSVAFGLVWF